MSQNPQALDEMVRLSGKRAVPVIVVGDKDVIVGFDREKIEKSIAKRK